MKPSKSARVVGEGKDLSEWGDVVGVAFDDDADGGCCEFENVVGDGVFCF